MPQIDTGRLPLEDALDDPPQLRSLLGIFERDAEELKTYIDGLLGYFERVHRAQEELAAASQCLSQHLRLYHSERFPLESDDDILVSTMKQLSKSMSEISAWYEMLSDHMAETVLKPVNNFININLLELSQLAKKYTTESGELDKSYARYSKISKKREVQGIEVKAGDEDVYAHRKIFHRASLQYFMKLNFLQYQRKIMLLEPVLGLLQALRSFCRLGNEGLNSESFTNFLSDMKASIQGVENDLSVEVQESQNLVDNLVIQCEPLYDVDPILPNRDKELHISKSSYLFYRIKTLGVMVNWERAYFFTQGSNLMCIPKGEVVGHVMVELDPFTSVMPTDMDDHRFVFQINTFSKVVTLQAMGEQERQEWLLCLRQSIPTDSTETPSQVQGIKQPSFLAEVGHFLVDKLSHATSAGAKPDKDNEKSIKQESAKRPKEISLADTPIMFDLMTPDEGGERQLTRSGQEGPPSDEMRVNPFLGHGNSLTFEALQESASYYETYTVRFLGCMQVHADRGHQLVSEVIRQILAARAIHNVFKMIEVLLLITHDRVKLVEPSTHRIKVLFDLVDVSYWAVHIENHRLFGFITRIRPEMSSFQTEYACYVFEADSSAEDIIGALGAAAKVAMERFINTKETEAVGGKEAEVHAGGEREMKEKKMDKEVRQTEVQKAEVHADGENEMKERKMDKEVRQTEVQKAEVHADGENEMKERKMDKEVRQTEVQKAEVHVDGENKMKEKKMDEEVRKTEVKQEDRELIQKEGEGETVGAQASKEDGSVNEDDELQKQGGP